MTGLDKIIENISAQANAKAEEILAEARKQAKEIIAESETAAGEECARIVDDAREEAALIGRISQSGSELSGRKMMLSTRRELLDETIAAAMKKLKSLPADEYFAVIRKLAVKYAGKGDGEIVLSEADKARVPAGFIDEINSQLAGGKLSLAQDSAQTDGGFILRYGGVEENCTFDAIAEQEHENISDELSSLLFG